MSKGPDKIEQGDKALTSTRCRFIGWELQWRLINRKFLILDINCKLVVGDDAFPQTIMLALSSRYQVAIGDVG